MASTEDGERLQFGFSASPFSVLTGALLSDSRRRVSKKPAQMAQEFGLSVTYLRTLESGTNSLSTGIALPLRKLLGVDFTKVALLLAVARHLDTRIAATVGGVPSGFDLASFIEKIDELNGQTDHAVPLVPEYSAVLAWCRDQAEKMSARTNDRDAAAARLHRMQQCRADAESGLVLLNAALRPQTAAQKKPSTTSLHLRTSGLSPVLEDLVRDMAARLSNLQPFLNRESLAQWEKSCATRVVKCIGYMSHHHTLTSEIETYPLDFLHNAFNPTFTVYVPHEAAIAQKLTENVRKGLRKRFSASSQFAHQANLADNVSVLPCGPDIGDYQRNLIFDIHSRALVPRNAREELISQRIREGRYHRMTNAWIYWLRHEDGGDVQVGLCENYDSKFPTRDFFGVFMNQGEVSTWRARLGGGSHDV